MNTKLQRLKVGIAGLGTIGKSLAMALDKGMPGLELHAVAVRDPAKSAQWREMLINPPMIVDFDRLAECDIVVECAPASLMSDIATPVLQAGKKLVVLSSGALLERPELLQLAKDKAAQIIVPTGALLGLDAVTAAAEGVIHSVKMVTRKPVRGLLGAPYLEKNNIKIDGITAPTRIFSGTAREAAVGFPANLNVAVALSLAGIGPDRTLLEIWADPSLERNTHTISVDADSASFSMTIENIPTDNPKTGRITALSIISLLRKIGAPMRVGS
ncbi:aspartate dehydrogenase [Herbaspirillum lusitanum]|uniref:aspartate dehydrogenase n=1 Tax=Herbaspirillum lusitanum TaxID=213312 RepID=UPI000377C8B3|nr:aspartate dehydrogenase [Herbaspirillum lusitanum]